MWGANSSHTHFGVVCVKFCVLSSKKKKKENGGKIGRIEASVINPCYLYLSNEGEGVVTSTLAEDFKRGFILHDIAPI